MKVRLNYYFCGVLIIIAHLVGETITHEISGIRYFTIQSFSQSVLLPVLGFLQISSLAQCTSANVKEVTYLRAIAPESGESDGPKKDETKRQPRLIKELTMLNRQSCLSKILCGVEVAERPSSSSSVMNDYAYIVKSFFDTLSLGDDDDKKPKKKKPQAEQDSDDSDEAENDDDGDGDEDDSNSYRSKSRTNSKKPYADNIDGFRDQELDSLFDKPLEELLDESDGSVFDFNRRRKKSGFLGYTNPRYDKTAFLDKKQLQIKQAEDDEAKLKIASEVALKLRSPRQCRLLSWLRNPMGGYTTTTTITTTSNDPALAQHQNAVNSMCPFTVNELQTMIQASQDKESSTPSSSKITGSASSANNPEAISIDSFINQFNQQNQASQTALPILPERYTPTPSPNPSRPKPKPYKIYPTKLTYPLSIYGESVPDVEKLPRQPTSQPIYSVPLKNVQPFYDNRRPPGYAVPPPAKPLASKHRFPQYNNGLPLQPPVRTTTQAPTTEGPFSNYFYLNADEPPAITNAPYQYKVTIRPKTPSDYKLKKANLKKKDVASDEDNSDEKVNEEPERDDNSEESDEEREQMGRHVPRQPPNHFALPPKRPAILPLSQIPRHQGNPNMHHQNMQRPPQFQSGPDPNNEEDSEESEEHKGSKRQATLSSEKFKSISLEHEDKVTDQMKFPNRFPPPPNPHAQNPHSNSQNDENDSEEEEEESKTQNKKSTTDKQNDSEEDAQPVILNDEGANQPIQDDSEESEQDKAPAPKAKPSGHRDVHPDSNESEEDGPKPNKIKTPAQDPNNESEEDFDIVSRPVSGGINVNQGSRPNDATDDESDEETTEPKSQKNPRPALDSNESEEDSSQINLQSKQPSKQQNTKLDDTDSEESDEKGDADDESQEDKPNKKKQSSPQRPHQGYQEQPSRRPIMPIHVPIIVRPKSQQKNKDSKHKQATVPRPVPAAQREKESQNNSTSVVGNSFLRHILSNNGMRTLSSITNMFYGSPEEDSHPHDGPPPGPPPPPRRRKKGPRPPPHRRRPRPRPHHDEDEEDEEEDDEVVTTTKKPPTTPRPLPLYPLQLPPKIVAVPIYLEGKENWEGIEKPHEEEFFEQKKKATTSKPEKYDYDDESGESSLNTSEGVDFGPGQKIHTEYSDIVDGVIRPGGMQLHNRYVNGLPTTWEDIYDDLKRQKEVDEQRHRDKLREKQRQKQSQKNNNSDEESDEDDEDHGPPPPQRKKASRPTRYGSRPPYSRPKHNKFYLEPID